MQAQSRSEALVQCGFAGSDGEVLAQCGFEGSDPQDICLLLHTNCGTSDDPLTNMKVSSQT